MDELKYDKSKWKLKDKTWLKKRKLGWKKIIITLKVLHIRNISTPLIKSFYLTGEVSKQDVLNTYSSLNEDEVDLNLPFQRMSEAPLLELWLTEDRTKKNLTSIVSQYSDVSLAESRRIFLESLCHLYYNHESLFSGLEEEICNYLDPTKINGLNPPTDLVYFTHVKSVCYQVLLRITEFLQSDYANPYNFSRFLLPRLKGLLPITIIHDEKVTLELTKKLVEAAYLVQKNAGDYKPLIVEVANDVIETLEDSTLPELVKHTVLEEKSVR